MMGNPDFGRYRANYLDMINYAVFGLIKMEECLKTKERNIENLLNQQICLGQPKYCCMPIEF